MTGKTDVGAALPRLVRNGSQTGNQDMNQTTGPADGAAFVDLLGDKTNGTSAEKIAGQGSAASAESIFVTLRTSRALEQAYASLNPWQSGLEKSSIDGLNSNVTGLGPETQSNNQPQWAISGLMPEDRGSLDVLLPGIVASTFDLAIGPNTVLSVPLALGQAPNPLAQEPQQLSSAAIRIKSMTLVQPNLQPDGTLAASGAGAPMGITIVGQEHHFGRDLARASLAAIAATPMAAKSDAIVEVAEPITTATASTIGKPTGSALGMLQAPSGAFQIDSRSSQIVAKDLASPSPLASASVAEQLQPIHVTRQIVDAVKPHLALAPDAAASMATASGSASAIDQGLDQTSPVRVLVVRLEPADLGIVTVRLTMKAGVLAIKLEASERATAAILESNRAALLGDLAAGGQRLGDLSVALVADSSLVPGAAAKQLQADSALSQGALGMNSGGQGSDGASGRGSGRSASRAAPHHQSANEADEPNSVSREVSRRSGVFL